MNSSGDLLVLWGKARPSPGTASFHPLICHLIDVAMVARAIWREVLTPGARARVAAALGTDEPTAEAHVAYWAGLHDTGKASPAFQRQSDADWRRVCAAWQLSPSGEAPAVPHGIVGALALPEILAAGEAALPRPVAQRVATLLGGHHGVFPCSAELMNARGAGTAIGRGPWERARRELAGWLAEAVGLPPASAPRALDNATALFLAGLVSVADWIGSNAEYFPYQAVEQLERREYARRACAQAMRALRALGWLGWRPPATARAFAELFPKLPAPNGLQRQVAALAEVLDGPGLVVVEAPMGEGKTEAAMYLVDRWAATSGQRGCYFALPTQATSNQMFGRVRDFLAERYPGEMVNLQLLHGHAALSAEFELLRRATMLSPRAWG